MSNIFFVRPLLRNAKYYKSDDRSAFFGQKKNKFSSPFDFRSQQKNPKKVQHIDLNVMFIKHAKICVDLLEWCFSILKIR